MTRNPKSGAALRRYWRLSKRRQRAIKCADRAMTVMDRVMRDRIVSQPKAKEGGQ